MNGEWYLLDEREGRVAVLLDAAGRPCRVPARQVPESATVRSIWLFFTMGITPAETGSESPALRARFTKR